MSREYGGRYGGTPLWSVAAALMMMSACSGDRSTTEPRLDEGEVLMGCAPVPLRGEMPGFGLEQDSISVTSSRPGDWSAVTPCGKP